jgi:tetratricopeptide (TPR) repeat protein
MMATTGRTRWIAYLLGAGLLVLLVAFGAQKWMKREPPLPVVTELPGMDGLSCADGLAKARELSRTAPDQGRLAYFWLFSQCADSSIIAEAMIEAGALLAYHLQKPAEAEQVYARFLNRFPTDPAAADVLLQLAKLQLDKGNYASAVTHLTQLVQDFPDSSHQESARFLADRAAELLAADRQAARTPLGRLQQMVPNNAASVLMLVMGFIPVVYTASNAAQKFKATQRTGAKLLLALVIVCIFTNFVINNFKKAQQIAQLNTEISALK